jgi:hypothetical protein
MAPCIYSIVSQCWYHRCRRHHHDHRHHGLLGQLLRGNDGRVSSRTSWWATSYGVVAVFEVCYPTAVRRGLPIGEWAILVIPLLLVGATEGELWFCMQFSFGFAPLDSSSQDTSFAGGIPVASETSIHHRPHCHCHRHGCRPFHCRHHHFHHQTIMHYIYQ